MSRLSHRIRCVLALVVIICPAGAASIDPGPEGSVAVHQDAAGVHLKARDATLADVAEALSKSLQLSIFLDVPARYDRVDLAADGSIDDIIRAAASRFDLVWERRKRIVLGRQGFGR